MPAHQLLYLAWVPPEQQFDHQLHISGHSGGQSWELLLLVLPALQPHPSVERVTLAEYLVGDGAHGPRVRFAVVNHHATSWNGRGHLWANTKVESDYDATYAACDVIRLCVGVESRLLLMLTSGAISDAFPPLLTHTLLNGSSRLESL